MVTIYIKNSPKINFKWDIYKGHTTVREDLGKSQAWCILTGQCDRWPISVDINEDGQVVGTLPSNLGVGIYSMMLVWAKDMYPVQSVKETFGAGKRNMAEVKDFICLSSDQVGTKDEYTINMTSYVATYGYDGMSAYELAVTRGMTTLTEKEWIQARMAQIEESQIADKAITSDKIADGAITVEKIAEHSITSDNIAPAALQQFCSDSVFWTNDEEDIKDLDTVYLDRLAKAEDDIVAVDTKCDTKAPLVSGKVPAAYLPEGLTQITEAASKSQFPATGDQSKLYVAKDTNKTYRWSGSQYVEVSESLALGYTSKSAFPGDMGKVAYDKTIKKFDVDCDDTECTIGLTTEGGYTYENYIGKATAQKVGMMSTEDKQKLDGFAGVETNVATGNQNKVPTVGGVKQYLTDNYMPKVGGSIQSMEVSEMLTVGNEEHPEECGIEAYGNVVLHNNIETEGGIYAEGNIQTDGTLRVDGVATFNDTIKVIAGGETETITPTKINKWNGSSDGAVTGVSVSRDEVEYAIGVETAGGTVYTDYIKKATTEKIGLMTPDDKKKLDSVAVDRDASGGMGYKVLKKGTSFKSQVEAVTGGNTIFEIRYNYDLEGGTVNVPSGCVLKFEGGKLSNGTVNGNNTFIEAGLTKIFNNISFTGSFANAEVYADWSYLENSSYMDENAINKYTNCASFSGKVVVLTRSTYFTSSTIYLRSDISLRGAFDMYSKHIIGITKQGTNLITLVPGAFKSNKISGLLLTASINQAVPLEGNLIYAEYEVEHLTVERCYLNGFMAGYSGIYLKTYANPSNGCNSLNVYQCKIAGAGCGVTVENGGDNCNFRDNNFLCTSGGCIKWDGIAGTASLNIENNSLVGGGKSLLDLSNVATITVRNNQMEVMTVITTEGESNSAVCIGNAGTFRQYCSNVEISHNNMNLKTGSLETAGTDTAIYLKNTYGGNITNNLVNHSTNYVKGSSDKTYKNIVVIQSAFFTTNYGSIVDPSYTMIVLDLKNGRLNLNSVKLKYSVTGSAPKESGVISQVLEDAKRFVTYDSKTGAYCDLNGYPTIRQGDTDTRTSSNLPNYLKNGYDMVGFCYFDTTLKKPLWYAGKDESNNVIWVDATGTTVQ